MEVERERRDWAAGSAKDAEGVCLTSDPSNLSEQRRASVKELVSAIVEVVTVAMALVGREQVGGEDCGGDHMQFFSCFTIMGWSPTLVLEGPSSWLDETGSEADKRGC